MKLIKLAVLSAVIVSGSAFATGSLFQGSNETTTIYQTGSKNNADVTQNHAAYSNVYAEQAGYDNYVRANQTGNNSNITSKQYGDSNVAVFDQSANASSAYVQQVGVNNWASVNQR